MFCLTRLALFLSRTLAYLGLILLSAVVSSSKDACPKDLFLSTHECLATFSLSHQRLQASPQKLCCGVDVETLRALCRAYLDDMSCVERLKTRCPAEKHRVIEDALVNLDGARDELHALCSDDTIIENYAMHQSCLTFAGPGSESCLSTHLDRKRKRDGTERTQIRFLSLVKANSVDAFCRKMSAATSCVQRNVQRACGPQAASLATSLVKPMVRYSATCDTSLPRSGHSKRPTRRWFLINDDFADNEDDYYPPDRGSRSNSSGGSSNSHNGRRNKGGNNSKKARDKSKSVAEEGSDAKIVQSPRKRNGSSIPTLDYHFLTLLLIVGSKGFDSLR